MTKNWFPNHDGKTWRAVVLLIAILGVSVILADLRHQPARATAQSLEAYFVVDSPPRRDQFVIKLTDPAKIQKARDILSGKEMQLRHVIGKIIKQPAAYNPPWSFHFDPASIDFFSAATEVCDGSMAYVETHLDEAGGAFLPGYVWCPWGSRLVKEIPPPVTSDQLTSVSGASYRRVGLAAEAIVSAFGSNLALTTEAATLPLPTVLAGTRVKVIDSTGIERFAPLYYVSPKQVNYLLPLGTEPGPASVVITNANGLTVTEHTQVLHIAPGLFTATADGKGLAAAVVQRMKADGSWHYEPVARFDPIQNKIVPIPIDLTPVNEQVFLLLFGTGLRRNPQAMVDATIGGQTVEVVYAGAQREYAGLDQVTLALPRELQGKGEVTVELMVDDHKVNPVVVYFK
jgi:uncharacterized protein (TIGR03437 family)